MPPQYIITSLKLSKPLLALENFVSNIEKYLEDINGMREKMEILII